MKSGKSELILRIVSVVCLALAVAILIVAGALSGGTDDGFSTRHFPTEPSIIDSLDHTGMYIGDGAETINDDNVPLGQHPIDETPVLLSVPLMIACGLSVLALLLIVFKVIGIIKLRRDFYAQAKRRR